MGLSCFLFVDLEEECHRHIPSWQRSATLPKWDITIVPN
jgi:hypothetical protein